MEDVRSGYESVIVSRHDTSSTRTCHLIGGRSTPLFPQQLCLSRRALIGEIPPLAIICYFNHFNVNSNIFKCMLTIIYSMLFSGISTMSFEIRNSGRCFHDSSWSRATWKWGTTNEAVLSFQNLVWKTAIPWVIPIKQYLHKDYDNNPLESENSHFQTNPNGLHPFTRTPCRPTIVTRAAKTKQDRTIL